MGSLKPHGGAWWDRPTHAPSLRLPRHATVTQPCHAQQEANSGGAPEPSLGKRSGQGAVQQLLLVLVLQRHLDLQRDHKLQEGQALGVHDWQVGAQACLCSGGGHRSCHCVGGTQGRDGPTSTRSPLLAAIVRCHLVAGARCSSGIQLYRAVAWRRGVGTGSGSKQRWRSPFFKFAAATARGSR